MSLKQFNESFNKYFTECFNEDEEILETTEDSNDDIEDISYMNFVDVDDMTSNAKESLKETYDNMLSDSDLQEIITTHKNDGKGQGIIGGGLISPTGINYLVEVAEALQNRMFNFLDNVQDRMNNVMHNIEVFDKSWSKEKQCIMKNIKEAQDLIPSEYRK